jgi:hypothetical protein
MSLALGNNTPFNYMSPRIAGLRNKALYCVSAFVLIFPFACRTDAMDEVPLRVHPAFFLRDADALISNGCLIRWNYLPLHLFIVFVLFLSLLCFIAWLDLWAFDWGTRQAREDWLVEAYLVLWIVDLLHIFLSSYFVLSNESLICCAVVVPLNEWETVHYCLCLFLSFVFSSLPLHILNFEIVFVIKVKSNRETAFLKRFLFLRRRIETLETLLTFLRYISGLRCLNHPSVVSTRCPILHYVNASVIYSLDAFYSCAWFAVWCPDSLALVLPCATL